MPEIDQILNQNRQLYQRKRDLIEHTLEPLVNERLISLPNLPEGGIYFLLRLSNGISAEEFLTWSLTKYRGQEITTFVPLTTKTGSFFTQDIFSSHQRLCFGLPEEKRPLAGKTFAQQLKAYPS